MFQLRLFLESEYYSLLGLTFLSRTSQVEGFELTDDEDMVGLYVGLIASSFAAAQFCSSIPWGWASDRFGRRPVLLCGLLGGLFSMALFGLSKNLAWAICSRALCGLLNGKENNFQSADPVHGLFSQ